MVRLVWSRIVRLPAEGSFRRLLKLLYSSIVPAGSTPFNGEPRDFGGILAQPQRSDTGLGFLLTGSAQYRIDSLVARHQQSPSRPRSRRVEGHLRLRP